MSLATPIAIRTLQRKLYRRAKEKNSRQLKRSRFKFLLRVPHGETSRRAGCRRSARPVVCPGKASMFSRKQSCRGRSQSPVVWIAEEMETEPLKPIDKVSLGEVTSHWAVSKENALWPRK